MSNCVNFGLQGQRILTVYFYIAYVVYIHRIVYIIMNMLLTFSSLLQIFDNYYHFVHNGISKRSLRPHLGKRAQLAVDTRINWAEQQKAKKRVKRDFRLQDSDPRWPYMWYLVSFYSFCFFSYKGLPIPCSRCTLTQCVPLSTTNYHHDFINPQKRVVSFVHYNTF